MLNCIQIQGRLGGDPEMRFTQGDLIPMCTLSIACERDTKEKEVDWFDIVCWRQHAEFAANYLTKGRMVVVQGRLKTSRYTDAQGNPRKSYEITVSSIYPCDSPAPRSPEAPAPQGMVSAPAPTAPGYALVPAGPAEEEISADPFADEEE